MRYKFLARTLLFVGIGPSLNSSLVRRLEMSNLINNFRGFSNVEPDINEHTHTQIRTHEQPLPLQDARDAPDQLGLRVPAGHLAGQRDVAAFLHHELVGDVRLELNLRFACVMRRGKREEEQLL